MVCDWSCSVTAFKFLFTLHQNLMTANGDYFYDDAEFLDVGKLKPALEVLSDVLRSKKHRTWQKVHEPIIEQYLNLCVELRKSQAAKEGLYQYKIICQQVSL